MGTIIQDRKYILWAALVAFLLICYQLAFKPTIEAWSNNRVLTANAAQSNTETTKPLYQVRKKRNLDTLIARFRIDTAVFRNQVLNKIGLIAQKQNVRLTDIPVPDALSSTGSYLIQKLVMEGEYNALLYTLDQMRSTAEIGFIRSVALQMPDRDRLTKQQVLHMTVYVETIR
ncbi:hypothetical protein ACVW0P_002552 [Mucilaginibacter sp. UYNi724]